MLGPTIAVRRRHRDEEEKPFWISFADLMTALMVLFLVVMGVALLAVSKTVSEQERMRKERDERIEKILDQFESAASHFQGILIDRSRRVIDFGDRAQFALNRWDLSDDQEVVLRRFVPEILRIADGELGHQILKRIVVEGYTDKTGSYLANLNLSLLRSQSVLCAMFATNGDSLLTDSEREMVRDLFLVGGFSFNNSKDTDEASRRVEMRLEFLGIDERRAALDQVSGNFGRCAI